LGYSGPKSAKRLKISGSSYFHRLTMVKVPTPTITNVSEAFKGILQDLALSLY